MGKPQLTTQETLKLAREAKRVVELLNKRLEQVELVADHAKTMQDMNSDVALGLAKSMRRLKDDVKQIKDVLQDAGL